MSKPIALMLMLTVAVPALANQAEVTPRASRVFGALRPQSDPYRKLFEPQKNNIEKPIDTPVSKPKVVCGMTIVPADPKNDLSMVLQPKADGVDYKIRAIDPPVCNPAR